MFRVEIETANAAFQDGMAEAEIARILRKIADELEAGWDYYTDRTPNGQYLHDVNGNHVGHVDYTTETETDPHPRAATFYQNPRP